MTIEGSSVQVGGSLEKSQENSGTLEILPQGKVEVMLFAQRREEYTEGRNYKFSNLFNFKKKSYFKENGDQFFHLCHWI